MIAPPASTPPNPDGANGCQLPGCTRLPPTTRKVTIATIFTRTMILLVLADSRIPRTSNTVRIKTTRKAGMLKNDPVHCPEAQTVPDHGQVKARPNHARLAATH